MDLSVVLILNVVILLAISTINNLWGKKTTINKVSVKLFYGVVFGGVMILMMNLAWGSDTGVFYDSRTVLISVIASMYSVYSTIIMIVIGSAYRIYIGGIGMVAGVVTIVATGILGILYKKFILNKLSQNINSQILNKN